MRKRSARIRLDRLARRLKVDDSTAWRMVDSGIVQGTNLGRGRGRGVFLTRDQAREFYAVALLRKAGVSLSGIRETVDAFRKRGLAGRSFFSLGTGSKGKLAVDGRGSTVSLQEIGSGQSILFATLDLRSYADQVETLLDELAEAASA